MESAGIAWPWLSAGSLWWAWTFPRGSWRGPRRWPKKRGVQDRAQFILWDVRDLGAFPCQDFDAALCLFTSFFGYYDEEEDRKFLASVRRLLRSGGIFVLDVPSRDRLVRSFQPLHVAKTRSHMIVEETDFDFEKSRTNSRWLFFLPEGNQWRFAGEARVSLRLYTLQEIIRALQERG